MTTLCGYDGPMADGKTANITLRMQVHTSASDYADFRSRSESYGITDRTGIGDQAFTSSSGRRAASSSRWWRARATCSSTSPSRPRSSRKPALVNQL